MSSVFFMVFPQFECNDQIRNLFQKNACEHVEGNENYMASPQCLGYGRGTKVTHKMCFPPKEEILRYIHYSYKQL